MSEREDVLGDLAAYGRLLQQLTPIGVRWPPAGAAEVIRAAVEDAIPPVSDASAARAGATPGAATTDGAEPAPDAASGLAAIRDTMGDCRRCKLAGGRKTIVFGQGNPRAELMFVGEGPGADEDEQGLAFVGRAGQLLTDIIEKGMKMKRSEVFIANVIKCRPPQNRNPEPDEIAACQPFLDAQIRAIRPKVLVGLGKFSAQWLLKTAAPITKIRGAFGSYEGIPVMPTYHPAYLLRNPAGKKDVWEDMKKVLALLGRPLA